MNLRKNKIIVFLCSTLLELMVRRFSPHCEAADTVYDITKYGAIADGKTINTEAIRVAIEEATNNGGGVVYIPSGTFLTGPIELMSNITLDISSGATLKFSDNYDDYLPMTRRVRWEGVVLNNFSPLIYADRVENIEIRGGGLLDGNGKKWWDFYWKLRLEANGSEWANDSKWQQEFLRVNSNLTDDDLPDDETGRIHIRSGYLRPHFILPIDSRNIVIRDVTLIDSPFWFITPVFCENITISGVTIKAPHDSPNTDGIDPDSCVNVLITNCTIDVGDDCVGIKSGRGPQARRINRPSENITVTNCRMFRGHGGIVIGSEMSGSVRNVRAHDLYFNGTDRGIRIKTNRGRGGVVENVRISNVVMDNIIYEGITLNMYYTNTDYYPPLEPVSQRTPIFRNMHISNVSGNANLAIQLLGLPEMPLNNITLEDINISGKQDIVLSDGHDIQFKNVTSMII